MSVDEPLSDAALRKLEQHWNAWGELDPFWAIMSVPHLRGNRWDAEQFFATGRTEIETVVRGVEALVPSLRRRRALDFGCGMGRVTQALGDHFDECHGVDIAESMIALAERFNRHGRRCRYHLNKQSHLGLFADGTFDFIYSNIVLQHMEPPLSKLYLGEFVRILAPGGIAVFQLPSELAPVASDAGAPAPRTVSSHLEDVPGDGSALPEEAFRARLAAPASLELEPAQHFVLCVTVTNSSQSTWPVGGSHKIGLCNRWLARDGARWGDAHVLLPSAVAPGESVEILLTIHAPREVGSYVMELDLVQSNVAWFADKGSQPTSVDVQVEGEGRDHGDESFEPTIEMWAVPRPEVVDLIEKNGGVVVDVEENAASGPEWISLRYVVAKPVALPPPP